MAARRNQSVATARIVEALPPIGNVQLGELIYNEATGRLYIRTIGGWKYVAFT